MSRKGYKSIGNLRDVDKRGCKSIGTPKDVAKSGVSLQFSKIYLPKGVFSVKSIGTFLQKIDFI